MLPRNATLRLLGLESNYIGPAGSAALSAALAINTTLQLLHLDGNEGYELVSSEVSRLLERNNETWLARCEETEARVDDERGSPKSTVASSEALQMHRSWSASTAGSAVTMPAAPAKGRKVRRAAPLKKGARRPHSKPLVIQPLAGHVEAAADHRPPQR